MRGRRLIANVTCAHPRSGAGKNFRATRCDTMVPVTTCLRMSVGGSWMTDGYHRPPRFAQAQVTPPRMRAFTVTILHTTLQHDRHGRLRESDECCGDQRWSPPARRRKIPSSGSRGPDLAAHRRNEPALGCRAAPNEGETTKATEHCNGCQARNPRIAGVTVRCLRSPGTTRIHPTTGPGDFRGRIFLGHERHGIGRLGAKKSKDGRTCAR